MNGLLPNSGKNLLNKKRKIRLPRFWKMLILWISQRGPCGLGPGYRPSFLGRWEWEWEVLFKSIWPGHGRLFQWGGGNDSYLNIQKAPRMLSGCHCRKHQLSSLSQVWGSKMESLVTYKFMGLFWVEESTRCEQAATTKNIRDDVRKPKQIPYKPRSTFLVWNLLRPWPSPRPCVEEIETEPGCSGSKMG